MSEAYRSDPPPALFLAADAAAAGEVHQLGISTLTFKVTTPNAANLFVLENLFRKGTLVCAIEFKSQVGPSFGNNFNNRVEEAIGSALDLWTAYREGLLGMHPRPFLGYFFLL